MGINYQCPSIIIHILSFRFDHDLELNQLISNKMTVWQQSLYVLDKSLYVFDICICYIISIKVKRN